MLKAIIIVGLGGAIGSSLRYITNLLMQKCINNGLPWGTLIANVLGCLLIGILMGYFTKTSIQNNEYKLLLVTGFCGGYTTFSAFAFENFYLIQQGNYTNTILYILVSVLGGILAVFGGFALIK
ncbi:MAG TPA: fluoride efflux transporter CrcB [Bacteroidia bacterium]|nr:fluoride efflux transporter CrcB [Bacteroidia bacterium]